MADYRAEHLRPIIRLLEQAQPPSTFRITLRRAYDGKKTEIEREVPTMMDALTQANEIIARTDERNGWHVLSIVLVDPAVTGVTATA